MKLEKAKRRDDKQRKAKHGMKIHGKRSLENILNAIRKRGHR